MSLPEVLERRDQALWIEEVPISALAEAFGTPLYVYSRSALRERAERLVATFGDAPHLVAYSIKANMTLAVVRTLLQAGCGVDVTSRGELERALRAGADPKTIVYSGVGKRSEEIDRGLEVGVRMLNVESLDELRAIDARAGALGVQAPISFRLNPDVDPRTHPKISTGLRNAKFGIPIEGAQQLYAQAKALPNVDAIGVDCHIGSQITELDPLRDALLKLRELVLELRREGQTIELIDIGGGLGVDYTGTKPAPSLEAYAELALETVGGLDATIVCEPGRSLTAAAGFLLSRVLYQKQNELKRFVVCDAGMNDYLRPALYGSPVRVEHDPLRKGPLAPADLVGPVCESSDAFFEDQPLPPVRNGDLVVLRDVGAYGFAMASSYNGRPLPAEVMVEGPRFELVRRRQTIEDTFAGERIPDWNAR